MIRRLLCRLLGHRWTDFDYRPMWPWSGRWCPRCGIARSWSQLELPGPSVPTSPSPSSWTDRLSRPAIEKAESRRGSAATAPAAPEAIRVAYSPPFVGTSSITGVTVHASAETDGASS